MKQKGRFVEEPTWTISEKNLVERSNQKLIYKERYVICGKCHRAVIKIVARGYHGHHQTLPCGYLCKNCKTLYIDESIRAVSSILIKQESNNENIN